MTQRSAVQPVNLISNRMRLLAPAALATAFMLRPLPGAAQEPADVNAMLESAITAMAELNSFTFNLVTLDGETQFIEGITLKDVSGAVERPMNFTATADVELIIASIKITIVSVDGRLWFTNPFGEADEFQEINFGEMSEFDPTVVINPDRLLLPALSIIESPVVAGEEELEDGVVANRIDGTVNLREVAGGVATPVSNEFGITLPDEVPFSVWIDAESLVRRIEVTGPVLPGDTEYVVRQVNLAGFNEEVDIQAPV